MSGRQCNPTPKAAVSYILLYTRSSLLSSGAARMLPNVSVILTSGGGGSFASALRERLASVGGGASEVRCSKVVDTLNGLTDVSMYMYSKQYSG